MNPLRIMVCIKQVIDPESPADALKIDRVGKKVIPVGVPPVINPYDENAIEVALRLKESQGAEVIAISIGEKLAQPVLRKALAAGVDDLILLDDSCYKDLDSYSIAYVLSVAVRKLGPFDLIVTGRQAADWDFGVTGLLLAEMLHIPSIHVARKIEIRQDNALVERVTDDGYEIVSAPMPVLVTVDSEAGELRWVSMNRLRAVSKTPLKVYTVGDLEVDLGKLKNRPVIDLAASNGQRECVFIEGQSPQEKAENLIWRMKQDRLI